MGHPRKWVVETTVGQVARYSGATLFWIGAATTWMAGVELYYAATTDSNQHGSVHGTKEGERYDSADRIALLEEITEVAGSMTVAGAVSYIGSKKIDKSVVIWQGKHRFDKQAELLLNKRGDELPAPQPDIAGPIEEY